MQNTSELHGRYHDDYETAKAEIHQALGSIKDIEIFGAQVLIACYVRPKTGGKGKLWVTTKAQTEDIYMGKAFMVLKLGPDAFKGDKAYLKALFGEMPAPSPGDWIFLRSQDGVMVSLCGDGASRPKGRDHKDEEIDLYDWDGWPCKIVDHKSIIGRMNRPHSVV